MRHLKDCLILSCLLLQAACTQGTPELTVLDEDVIPRPMFSGSTVKQMATSSSTQTFSINGECDSQIRALQGSATGTNSTFSTLAAMSVSSVSVTCSTDGKFSFVLKSLTDLGYTATEGQTYEIQLRGETSGGISKPSLIKIMYGAAANGRPILITSGTNTAINGNLSAEIRITNKQNAVAAANGDDTSTKTGAGGLSATIGVKINH